MRSSRFQLCAETGFNSLFTFDLTKLTGVEDISFGEWKINEGFKIKKSLTEYDKIFRDDIFAMLNLDDPAKELLEVKKIENPKHPCYDECGLFAKCDIEANTLFSLIVGFLWNMRVPMSIFERNTRCVYEVRMGS